MKELIKRIIGVLVFFLIMLVFFSSIVRCTTNIKYKYLTYDGKWGVSNNCYEENEYLVCVNDTELVKVMQFYYEE